MRDDALRDNATGLIISIVEFGLHRDY